jgi:radical SAM protein with 4Fe4S-binding SPASM domain
MRSHRLHLNVTEQCNLRCVHCYWDEYGAHADPSLEQLDAILLAFKRFARGLGEEGRHTVTIGGGEPTIRKDLESIIRLAVARGFDVRLVTNAVNVDEVRARSLAAAGLKVVQVSLDGATQATHDRVRGRNSWARTMRGIRAFDRAGIFQVLSYVLLPGINLDEAPALLDLADQLGVAGVKYARPVEEGQVVQQGVRTDGDYFGTFQRVLAHADARGYRRLLLFFDPLAHLLPVSNPAQASSLEGLATDLCQCDNTELVEVNAGSGDIYYCRIRESLGNIWTDDLGLLWQTHALLQRIRGKSAGGACEGCSVWDSCRGGCSAVTHARFGSATRADSDCPRHPSDPGVTPAPAGLVPATRLRRKPLESAPSPA